MKKSFVLHDETVNTYGFRMLTSGCDLTEFKKNPVMLLNHNDWQLPIGRWENIRIEGTQILGDPVFDLKDTREQGGAEIARKVESDFLRMASIGAWAPEEIDDETARWITGQTRPTVTKWKAREASIVTIGSNHNALAFYDKEGKIIDLTDLSSVIKLMDSATKSFTNSIEMNELNQLLNLSDTASMPESVAAVRAIIADRDKFKQEKEAAEIKLADIDKVKKDEFIALVDVAVADGRIDAAGKEPIIALYDVSPDKAKAALNAIPKRITVQEQFQAGDKDAIELADLTSKSWDEIDSAGKQGLLKSKYPDLYEQKFEAKFGKKPKK